MRPTSSLPAEDVEVLGVALDAGVALEGVGAADQVGAARRVERRHGGAVEARRSGVEVRGRAVREVGSVKSIVVMTYLHRSGRDASAKLSRIADAGHRVLNAAAGVRERKVQEEAARCAAAFAAGGVEAEVRQVPGPELLRPPRGGRGVGADVVVMGGRRRHHERGGARRWPARASPMGVLPLGTLNHFARDLGIPQDLEGAVRRSWPRASCARWTWARPTAACS